MKHIKLFEDYSDEELRDLQDTLHDIGHKSRFVLGEDFGIGFDFETSISGKTFPCISKEFFEHLLKKREIIEEEKNLFRFKNDSDFGIPYGLESLIISTSDSSCINISPKPDNSHNRPENPSEWVPIFREILKKLGEVRK